MTHELRSLRQHRSLLAREYGEAKQRVLEYERRPYLRPGERLEAKTLEHLTRRKRAALDDVGQRLFQLEAGLASRKAPR